MRSTELARLDRLRQVMRLSARGKGIAAAVVETFGGSPKAQEVSVARSILLGRTVEESISPLLAKKDHSRDLLMFLVAQAKVDAPEASRRADRLSELFERWIRAKQSRLIDQRIMETRSLMVSGILGGVTAMVAAIAPVLSSFQLTLAQTSPAPSPSPYLGLFFVTPGAFFLGLFFSPRRAALNLAVSLVAFTAVAFLFSPLLSGM